MDRPDYEPAGYETPRRDGDRRTLPHRRERIEKGLADLDNTLDRLADLLAPLLGPERPTAALQGSQPGDDAGSDLGRALDAYSERLGMLIGRLSYLCDRLDL